MHKIYSLSLVQKSISFKHPTIIRPFFRATLRCPPEICGSTKCRCGVLSFPEAGLLKETLLKPAATNTGAKIQVNITDSNVIAGIENLKTVLNLRTATNPKIVGAALTIDPALNVFVGTQGMLNTIPFYRSIIIVCYGLIESLFKLIKGYLSSSLSKANRQVCEANVSSHAW